jgi:hypothetical protein
MRTDNQPTNSPNSTYANNTANVSQHEASWRTKFPKILVLILSIVQFIFTVLIFVLEIASLAIYLYLPTGVGIWCAVAFLPACILTFILGKYFLFDF